MAPPRDRRPGFSRRAQFGLFFTYILAIAGAVVGAVLLALQRFDPPAFSAVRAAVAEVTTPLASGGRSVVAGLAAIPEAIGTYFRVHDENARLRAERDRTRALLLRARAMGYENLRLRRIAAVREASPEPVVTARIVTSTAASTRRFGILNAGLWQGVRRGQPVRGPNGLIGRIVEAGPNSARVLLLTDAESVIPVRRARDGRPALVSGRGDVMLDVRGVEAGDPGFRPGDLFITSGTGGIYAPGVPVAILEKRTPEGGWARAVSNPAALDFAVVSQAFLPPPPPVARPAPLPAPSPTPTAAP
ncbi:rod shape-determining protein MreC [Sphingomonas sp.]|jgi:rod shape-determining protein MreC|uniref:rod shape-determining protein MreC n=1 Tax=Sphingomonas sp. TaxID=28214 RepID=UPI0035C80735